MAQGHWPASGTVLSREDAFWGLAADRHRDRRHLWRRVHADRGRGGGAVYACFVGAVFIYRDLKLIDVPRVLVNSGHVTVMLLFIITNALLFATC